MLNKTKINSTAQVLEQFKLFTNKKIMNYIELSLRWWMAYLLISNSGIGTLTPLSELGLPPHIFQILNSMWETGFMMHLVKLTELVTGLMLFFNFFVPIGLLALIPVVINIYGIHIFLFHSFITDGLYMLAICAFLVFRHREKYRSLLVVK
jgi:uncharacterized membrane protein YphA (DoxX/SURF4 family)